MKKKTSMILGYEDFSYAHQLDKIPLTRSQKRQITLLANKTAKHYKQQYQLNDLAEACIRAALFQSYLLGKKG